MSSAPESASPAGSTSRDLVASASRGMRNGAHPPTNANRVAPMAMSRAARASMCPAARLDKFARDRIAARGMIEDARRERAKSRGDAVCVQRTMAWGLSAKLANSARSSGVQAMRPS